MDLSALRDDPRVAVRRDGPPRADAGAVVYWMQRAQRAADNPALDTAITAGNALRLPVVALFVLVPGYPSANARHYAFMLDGLRQLPRALGRRRVTFMLRDGEPVREVARVCEAANAALLVGDENPLRETERWRREVARQLKVPFWTVDSDVVVPGVLLEKEQFSAATIRPRIHRQLEWCLRPSPQPAARHAWRGASASSARGADAVLADIRLDRLAADQGVQPVAGLVGGAAAGHARLRSFVRQHLRGYAEARNEPSLDGTSRLSPYLHFGHLGPREVARHIRDADAPLADRQAFLEQLIVRRELAVNFVRFNPQYDRVDGCERWARETLERHRSDERPWRYRRRQLEAADTHDPLWNAAQRQMMQSGWMHGYLRMYWAKKILEWSASPEEAFDTAIGLNDRYEIDGRDPNGYAGVAWAIGGKHDRAWGPERQIFGTVRYMSLASTSRKFDSQSYIARWGR